MKLNYRRTFFIGFAFLAISAFWQMYDNIIPLILQNTFHLSESVIGMIMAVDNVLAVVLLPVIGTLSDRVDTPLGKRTPFIIGGTAAAVCLMLLLPAADRNENRVLFIVALGATLLAMAMYRSPAVALMPDLTPKPLRSKANAVINLMGAIGGVYTLLLIRTLVGKGKQPDYFPVFTGVAAIMVLSVVLLVLTTKEKKIAEQVAAEYPEQEETAAEKLQEDKAGRLDPAVKKSLVLILLSVFFWFAAYNAVTTAFSRYAVTVWGMENGGYAGCLMTATVAAIISYIPIGLLASRFGRKKMILLGIVLMGSCFLMAGFMPEYHPVINVGFCMIGFGWAAIGVNSLPMVVEMSKSGDIGKYIGLYYTFSMSAQIATPVLSGLLLDFVSYRTLFPYAVVFCILAFVTMSMVKHGDNRPESKKDILENFDVED
ncbi:MAG: MFS transporter [Lachnospiraceae bacterium]|nr:MFS transporter [Lachnospiraceae bacterium]